MLRDSYGREIRDLRLSVTGRCNFRCFYCRATNPAANGNGDILPLADFRRIARVFACLGITKVRVTGGEPLLRPGIEDFIAGLRGVPGLSDRTITTNGWLLAEKAVALAAAGLTRVNISLDSVHREKFARVAGVDGFDRVAAGIEACGPAGLRPVKVNVVLVRGLNDDEIVDFATFGRERGVTMRFIEFMPLGGDPHWAPGRVVPAREVLERISAVYPLEELGRDNSTSTALKYRYKDGAGEIGMVAPVSLPFCNGCSRIRVTADGKIRTCLFSLVDHDLLPLLRGGASDQQIADFIAAVARSKEERHHINEPDFVKPERTMLFIGG